MVAFNLAIELAILVFIGWLIRKLNVVSDEFRVNLSRFILSVALPCLVIDTFSVGFDHSQMRNLISVIIITVIFCIGVMFAFGCLMMKFFGGGELGRVARFAIMYPNFSFMGIPVTQALYGDAGLMYFNILLVPMRLVYYITIEPMLVPSAGKKSFKQIVKTVVSPVTVGLAIGLVLFFTGWKLPEVLEKVVSNLSDTASPLGMVMCGMILSNLNVKKLFARPKVFLITALRILVIPALALLAVIFLPVDPLAKKVVVLYCAMPSASLLATYSVRYGLQRENCESASVVVFSTTLLCVATLPLWYAILEAAIR